MEKPAPIDHPIHTLLEQRWSTRAFAERSVDEATVRSLLEAARWAPSSMNANGSPASGFPNPSSPSPERGTNRSRVLPNRTSVRGPSAAARATSRPLE
ncbi:MAG: nitroreductase family protein [Deltaproteobacteria bacterium]|nr:nitroreductase family protein [Deltaproteobacteria bacterium]